MTDQLAAGPSGRISTARRLARIFHRLSPDVEALGHLFGPQLQGVYMSILGQRSNFRAQKSVAGGRRNHAAQIVAVAFHAGRGSRNVRHDSHLARLRSLASRRRCQFVLRFIGSVALSGFVGSDASVRSSLGTNHRVPMTVALTAVGLETRFSTLKAHGPRPFLLGLVSWLFISSATLALVLVAF